MDVRYTYLLNNVEIENKAFLMQPLVLQKHHKRIEGTHFGHHYSQLAVNMDQDFWDQSIFGF